MVTPTSQSAPDQRAARNQKTLLILLGASLISTFFLLGYVLPPRDAPPSATPDQSLAASQPLATAVAPQADSVAVSTTPPPPPPSFVAAATPAGRVTRTVAVRPLRGGVGMGTWDT